MFIIILLIGSGLVIYGTYYLFVRIKLIPMSKIITGTVVDMHEATTRRNGKAYFPVIEYFDPETESIKSFEHEVGDGRSKYNIGDTLELRYYNGEGRKLVLVNSWSGIWSAPVAFIIAGVIFTAFGVLMILI